MNDEQSEDLCVDIYRASGGGPGSVGVVITHYPTGLKGYGEDQRGRQSVAKDQAMDELHRALDWHYGPWL